MIQERIKHRRDQEGRSDPFALNSLQKFLGIEPGGKMKGSTSEKVGPYQRAGRMTYWRSGEEAYFRRPFPLREFKQHHRDRRSMPVNDAFWAPRRSPRIR